MTIDDFEQLPSEGDLGLTPPRPGVANVLLALGAAAACGAVAMAVALMG